MEKRLKLGFKKVCIDFIQYPDFFVRWRALLSTGLGAVEVYLIRRNYKVLECAVIHLIKKRLGGKKYPSKIPYGFKDKTKMYGKFLECLLDVIQELEFWGIYSDFAVETKWVFLAILRELSLVGLSRFVVDFYPNDIDFKSKREISRFCSRTCSKIKRLEWEEVDENKFYKDGFSSALTTTIVRSMKFSETEPEYRKNKHIPMIKALKDALQELEENGYLAEDIDGQMYQGLDKRTKHLRPVDLSLEHSFLIALQNSDKFASLGILAI